GDRPLEHREGLVDGRARVAVVEAGALARVARRPRRLDKREHGVVVAVVAQLAHALHVARRLPLVPPLLARAAPEPGLASRARASERLLVHVGHGEDLPRAPVLHDTRDEAAIVE